MTSKLTIGLVLVAGAALASCARSVPPPRLLSWEPPLGQQCQLASSPERTPVAPEVVDSAAVARIAADLFDGQEGAVVLEVSYDSMGGLAGVKVVESSLEIGVAESLANRVESYVLSYPSSGGHSILLRLTRDGVLAGRGEHCWPNLSNPREVRREFSRRFSRYMRSGPDVRRPVRPAIVDLRIDSLGHVIEIKIYQLSGVPEVDRISLDVSSLLRFHPARINGRAVSVTARIPITLEVLEEEGQETFPPPLPVPGSGLPPRRN